VFKSQGSGHRESKIKGGGEQNRGQTTKAEVFSSAFLSFLEKEDKQQTTKEKTN